MIRLEMKNYNMTLIEKQPKYLTGEDILPSNQQQIIEQVDLLVLLWEKLLRNK